MTGHVLAISGGVGGAKLAAGLAAVLPPERLTIAVNTGDDFEHMGLTICPDIDSVLYALAGLNDRERGWGVNDETWHMMEMLRRMGEPDWFNLGDRDLATHLVRTDRLRRGQSLSQVTSHLARAHGIGPALVPMSDVPVRTQVQTDEGWLDFQHYFVAEQCRPVARAIRFAGTPGATPSPGLLEALNRPDLAAVVLCPSNPFLSVDPVLAVDGVRGAVAALQVPCIAVSPLVGGKSLKGPLGKLLGELGLENSNSAIATHYRGLVGHLVIDRGDADDRAALQDKGLAVTVTDTIMRTPEDQARLAQETLAAAGVPCGVMP